MLLPLKEMRKTSNERPHGYSSAFDSWWSCTKFVDSATIEWIKSGRTRRTRTKKALNCWIHRMIDFTPVLFLLIWLIPHFVTNEEIHATSIVHEQLKTSSIQVRTLWWHRTNVGGSLDVSFQCVWWETVAKKILRNASSSETRSK